MDEEKLTIFKAWLREEELSENTINSYVFAVNDFFTKYPVISKANLILWKQEMLEKKSPKTVNLRLCAIDRWIRFDGANVENVKRIRYQKQTTVENAMNFETYKRLIKCLEQEGNEKWIAYYKLLATTGARISEALNLTKADLEKGVAVMQTKGKVRRIYIPTRLKEECANVWGELEDGDFLISNKQGNKMTSRGFASMMKKHASMYGLPLEKMHPHAFRHMFAIEFLKRNNNISLLADIMGHSGVNTTMIYTRRSEQEQRQAFNNAINW